jgi:phospholipid transport system substrate-binding protein
MRRVFFGCLALVLALPVQAVPAATQSDPTGLDEPTTVLRHGIETLTGYLDNHHSVPPEQLRYFLDTEIVPYIDFQRMSYWAAGSLNRYLTPLQRRRLSEFVKARFLNAMVAQLGHYRQSYLEYLPLRGNPYEGEVTLALRVYGVNDYPVLLEFRLYRAEAGWKVYDVVANGLSAVAHYRNELSLLAQRYGVEGLLARLSQ